jgi:hypothetical protein
MDFFGDFGRWSLFSSYYTHDISIKLSHRSSVTSDSCCWAFNTLCVACATAAAAGGAVVLRYSWNQYSTWLYYFLIASTAPAAIIMLILLCCWKCLIGNLDKIHPEPEDSTQNAENSTQNAKNSTQNAKDEDETEEKKSTSDEDGEYT